MSKFKLQWIEFRHRSHNCLSVICMCKWGVYLHPIKSGGDQGRDSGRDPDDDGVAQAADGDKGAQTQAHPPPYNKKGLVRAGEEV